jgi:hypothetical protein
MPCVNDRDREEEQGELEIRREKKQKPPVTSVTGGSVVHDVKPGPRLPLHPECLTICRFSQYCLASIQTGLLACLDLVSNGRQGPHPPFHSSLLVPHPAVALSRRGFFYQTVELLEPRLDLAMLVPIADPVSHQNQNQLL